jgi:hypothetical protein
MQFLSAYYGFNLWNGENRGRILGVWFTTLNDFF